MMTGPRQRQTPEEAIRRSADIARALAETARQHHEPLEAERFETIAAEADVRADRVAKLARAAGHERQPARRPT